MSLPPKLQEDVASFMEQFAPEELVPELKKHLRSFPGERGWKMIHHPLVLSVPHNEGYNRLMNRQLEQKKVALEEAKKQRDWDTYVFLHERPYRAQVLVQIIDKVTMTKKGWGVVAHVWSDSETPGVNLQFWSTIFEYPDARRMMTISEYKKWARLHGKPVTIYRGSHPNYIHGLSWTTDRDKAIWFAERAIGRFGAKRPVLGVRVVDSPEKDIVALLHGRNENEVLIHPRLLKQKKDVEVLPIDGRMRR